MQLLSILSAQWATLGRGAAVQPRSLTLAWYHLCLWQERREGDKGPNQQLGDGENPLPPELRGRGQR